MRRAAVDERRAEILNATCAVVRERGFAATRIGDVARRLGISTGLVHYHFDSKEQLLAEAFAFAAQGDLHRLEDELATVDDPLERVDRVIKQAFDPDAAGAWAMWIDGWGESLRNDAVRTTARDFDAGYAELIRSAVAAGAAAGRFRCADPAGAAWRLGALIDGLAVQVFVHRVTVAPADAVDWIRAAARHELGLADSAADAAPGGVIEGP